MNCKQGQFQALGHSSGLPDLTFFQTGNPGKDAPLDRLARAQEVGADGELEHHLETQPCASLQ